jgi:GNAT superfamily N-acetyltransferase
MDKNIFFSNLKTQQEFIECCYLCDSSFDGYTAEFFYRYLLGTGIDGKNSVIAKVGDEIIGLCIVTNEKIHESYPEFKYKKPIKYLRLKRRQNKCISVLAIKPEYRNLGISTTLINTTIDNLRNEGCTWCYVQVLHHLKTHTLWKKYGCKEIFDDGKTKSYVLPLTPKVKKIIGECMNINLNKRDFEFIMENINIYNNIATIKLTESKLKNMISEAVKTAINEIGFNQKNLNN